MKNATIYHGTECKPKDFWYVWLKEQLEEAGYEVDLPYYPDMNRVPIAEFLPKVMKTVTLNSDTVLIGHSAGVPLILSMLEHTDQKIALVVMVAGFSKELPGEKDVILQDSYDWKKIKEHATDFIFINSDNDPWGCDDKQGKRMQEKLGGRLIVKHDGHFGSISLDQPYKKFPLLRELILG